MRIKVSVFEKDLTILNVLTSDNKALMQVKQKLIELKEESQIYECSWGFCHPFPGN